MHSINVDPVNKYADFEIHDEHELELLHRGIAELMRKQELKTVRRSSRDVISPLEVEKLERYRHLNEILQVGPVRLTINEMFDLENAVNEGLAKYEKEVTDNPEDDTVAEMKSFQSVLHDVLRTDILHR